MSELKAPPRIPRALQGGGRLPELENLQGKSAEQLVKTLSRFGIDPDYKAIEKRAISAYRRLDHAIQDGVEPDEHTWNAIDGQLETEMEGSLRKMAKAAIRNYRTDKLDDDELQMWVAVNGGAKSCPSCEDRHGEVDTLDGWKEQGLPGSGALICGAECNCELVPVPPDAEE